jgi:hypothetical protein
MNIVLRTYYTSGAHGDRATHQTAYKNYKVFLTRDNGVEVEIADFNGYDSFNSHIRPDRRREAEEYANNLWDFFSLNGAVVHEEYREKVVSTRTWEKVS